MPTRVLEDCTSLLIAAPFVLPLLPSLPSLPSLPLGRGGKDSKSPLRLPAKNVNMPSPSKAILRFRRSLSSALTKSSTKDFW